MRCRPRTPGRLATRLFLVVLATSIVAPVGAQTGGIRMFDEDPPTVVSGPLSYRIVATRPRLNRRVMGPVTAWVDGVPAEPVDSFCWSGEGSVPIEGTFVMVVNVEDEAGFVQAEWTDRNGEWVYQQQEFIHPEHLSGIRIGRSRADVQPMSIDLKNWLSSKVVLKPLKGSVGSAFASVIPAIT